MVYSVLISWGTINIDITCAMAPDRYEDGRRSHHRMSLQVKSLPIPFRWARQHRKDSINARILVGEAELPSVGRCGIPVRLIS
jgi:hypothetical protein